MIINNERVSSIFYLSKDFFAFTYGEEKQQKNKNITEI